MKKQLVSVLLAGAMVAPVFFSCESSKLTELDKRVTALEGAWHETEVIVKEAVVAGSTILSATQDNGVWTLKLSDGKEIVIAPATGGGADVTVEEKADCFVITINGTAYAIPKASPIGSLVFVPEYGTDLVTVGNDGETVKFLATPAFTSLDGITFGIADAREVATKAGENLFSVNSPALVDGLLAVNLRGTGAEAGKVYIVALKATVQGASISSNYFRVQVGDDFSFDPEALEDPVFADGISAEKVGDSYRAALPATADFLGEFDLKSLFKELPAGDVTFELAPAEDQNGQVASRYDFFKSCIVDGHTWKMQGRPGTSCYDPEKDGIYIYAKVNDQIKSKIFWTVNDPIRTGLASFGRDDDPTYGDIHYSPDFPEAQHMEYRTMVPAGENHISFIELFMKSKINEENDYLWFQHGDAPKAIEWIQNLSISVAEPGDILYSDGTTLALGDLGASLARHSKGIWWQSTQPSIVSSQRDNLSEEQKQAVKDEFGTECNGEIIGGWDGNAWDVHEQLGYDWNEKEFVTTAAYTGTAFRFGLGLRFEYDYGQIRIGGWHTCYMFFNRRLAPEGAKDIQPK
jgi:hypothetical protein